jgi:hypothetical protein
MLGSKTVAEAKLGINLPFRKHIMPFCEVAFSI